MTTALDVNRPETANAIGADLAVTTESLAHRLAITTITDVRSLEQAVNDRQMIGDATKRVQEFFRPIKQMADRLHHAICDRENDILAPLQRVDAEKRTAIREFTDADNRRRQEEERQLAEQRRRDQQEQAAHEAAHLENAGEHALAAAVVEEAIAAPMPVVVLPPPAISGLKFRRYWRWRYAGGPADVKKTAPDVVNRALQVIPRNFLCVDMKKLNTYAESMQASAAIPGIEVYYVDEPVR